MVRHQQRVFPGDEFEHLSINGGGQEHATANEWAADEFADHLAALKADLKAG